MKKLRGILALIAIATVFCGVGADASTADSKWSFINFAGRSYTAYRQKDGNGNVYCFPITGGSVYVTVGKASNSSGKNQAAASKKVALTKGTRYTIVNSVGAGKYARLKFDAMYMDSTTNTGKWSPDASKNYTVVGK